jgi:hypothetical protein
MKIAAIREIPQTVEKTTILAVLACMLSITAIIIALGARHGS